MQLTKIISEKRNIQVRFIVLTPISRGGSLRKNIFDFNINVISFFYKQYRYLFMFNLKIWLYSTAIELTC